MILASLGMALVDSADGKWQNSPHAPLYFTHARRMNSGVNPNFHPTTNFNRNLNFPNAKHLHIFCSRFTWWNLCPAPSPLSYMSLFKNQPPAALQQCACTSKRVKCPAKLPFNLQWGNDLPNINSPYMNSPFWISNGTFNFDKSTRVLFGVHQNATQTFLNRSGVSLCDRRALSLPACDNKAVFVAK